MINKKDIFTISNALSFLRLLLIIPVWILLDNFQEGNNRIYLGILALTAAVTDILDGYVARKLDQVTETGKIIDPLADKILMGLIIVKLFLIDVIPSYYFFMIIGRDILIFLGGIYVSKKIGKVLPSNMLGKITVTVIGIVILMIFFGVNRDSYVYLSTYGISIILIFASLIGYIIRAIEFIKQKKNYGSI